MKKIYIILLILIILISTGCSQDSKNNNEQTFQSEIITNHSSYDIEDYKKIKSTALDFELALLDKHINITSISFEINQYVNGDYKTVVYTITPNLDITLKFNKNEKLMLASIICLDDEEDEDEYNDTKSALLEWDYFDFNYDEEEEAYALDDKTLNIGNFEIDSSSIGFVIMDTRYKE